MNTKPLVEHFFYLALGCLISAGNPLYAAETQHSQRQSSETHQTTAAATGNVPLYDDLGDHHYRITTQTPEAQAYFDQGMRLYYAFNHAEAIRAFRAAQQLDPLCAMCWWGEAMAWGPNINLAMDQPAGEAAYQAIRQALDRREHASERERALIEALSRRYAEQPPEERAHLDRAYFRAMARLADTYPDDRDIQVLYAESVMDLQPWDYWQDDGTPKPGMAEALSRLQAVIAANPDHPGACHFYIHAVEKLYPERAVECAERLANLMPGAGHLVHMPGHIYIRVGRYLDAVKANQHAIHADETYIRDQNPAMGMYTAGYYPHNYDFLAFATMMIGQSRASIEAADKVAALIPPDAVGSPGMDFLQHWKVRPLLVRIRFARWGDILESPAPDAALAHTTAMWHYARGRAYVAQGDIDAATAELEQLRRIAQGEAIGGLRMEFNASADLLEVAERILTGWVHSAAGRHDDAEQALREGVAREDRLLYGEPPEWTVPARQDLGAALLAAGRDQGAEAAFREDLQRFPKNGWSLHGLGTAIAKQGRQQEADAVKADFEEVWKNADVEMTQLF